MRATFTDDQLTPLTFQQAADSMRAALASVTKVKSLDVLALALAKNALETGRWKSCHNFNLGNIKAGDSFVGMYTAFACNEVLTENGKRVVVWFSPRGRLDRKGGKVVAQPFDAEPWHPQCRFRAYANEYDGSFEYVDFVAGGRYAAAWQSLLIGDAVGFVHNLKAKGYFTADEGEYLVGVRSMQKEFLTRLNGLAPDPALVAHNKSNVDVWAKCTIALYDGLDLSERDDAAPDTERNA